MVRMRRTTLCRVCWTFFAFGSASGVLHALRMSWSDMADGKVVAGLQPQHHDSISISSPASRQQRRPHVCQRPIRVRRWTTC
ncbi:hypothetical protein BC567DRAFT_239458 [Phyllosticta citribraziliensis]